MIKKECVLISVLFLLLFNVVLVSAQETTREVEVDILHPGPEFTIHWRYGDFSSNIRADIVVSLVDS